MSAKGEFFPNGRWFYGLALMLVSYAAYISAGSLVENTLPTILKPLAHTSWAREVIDSTSGNFWIGVVLVFCGFLLYLVFAGIPGTEVEKYEGI